ncbi:MAG: glucose-1-phosphate adenylyltransferase subunit GlgD [Clostridia bacterium]|nr:glucose-1-phosphate adenylyltransferase subunit GlgD [Clostridia bacterium]
MKDVMGILYTSKDELSLRELTAPRSVAALPVASRYRLVDFLLSSFVNSGVRKVGVIMQGNYQSLMDHLETGKAWDLHTRNNGLRILPPHSENGTYAGVMDGINANAEFLRRSNQEYVLLLGGRMIFNAKFDDLFKKHIDSDADITVMYTKYDPIKMDYSATAAKAHPHVYVNVAEDGQITDIEVNPNAASYDNMLTDVVFMKRTLLMHLADQANAHGQHDFHRDVLPEFVKSGSVKVVGYEYTGYFRRVETIKGFYRLNMDLLNPEIRKEIFSANPVYTKTREDAPAKYMPGCKVTGSLIADGCVIEGTVENCVLFRGVHVGKGAVLKDSIIMQDSEIGPDCELENVIFDKDVTIRSGARLISDKMYPIVIGKNVTL